MSFNITLVWLENAYSRPFLEFLGHIYPQMMSLIAERITLGLNNVIWAITANIFRLIFDWASLESSIFYWFNIMGPQKCFLGVLNMVGVNIAISVSRSICWYDFYANRFSGLGGVVTHTYIYIHTEFGQCGWYTVCGYTGDLQYQTCCAGFDNAYASGVIRVILCLAVLVH